MGKHRKHRIVCYALAFCLLLSLLPAQVFAAREEPAEEVAEDAIGLPEDAPDDIALLWEAAEEPEEPEAMLMVSPPAGGTCGDNLTWELDEAGTLTISGTGDMENYTEENPAPWRPYSFDSAIVQDGVTGIGDWAFLGCDLTDVNIGNSVTHIGDEAFYGCRNLPSITIPASVTSIGKKAFIFCDLMEICVSENNSNFSSVDGVLFNKDQTMLISHSCNKQGEYTIPDGVTCIGDGAFYFCYKLTGVTIPDSVNSIGDEAFEDCSGLTGVVNIPDGVTSIGDRAFFDCSRLTGVNIGNSVTSIGDYAFAGCRGLTGVMNIPDGVTSIGSGAFSGCSSLTGVLNIPNSVTSIGSGAFAGCSGLTGVTIPDGVTSIENSVFSYCSSLTGVINIPDGVTSIGIMAFAGCRGLTGVMNIPDGVTSIGRGAFDGCSGLTGVRIPDSVTEIGEEAFDGCSGLTGVHIPNGVTTIESFTFKGCASLRSITVPGGVTSIGDWAFNGCASLTSVIIPDSLTGIGNRAFEGCDSLRSVTVPDGMTGVRDQPIYKNGSLTGIGERAFYKCGNLTSVSIPDGVTSIGEDAFYGCSSLTNVTIPASVTSIGEVAFSGCSSLTGGLNIPDGVTSIGRSAFSGCSSLTNLHISCSLTSLEASVFSGCSSLTSVRVPDGVTNIGFGAFSGCKSLTNVFIPDSVTNMEADAFSIFNITGPSTSSLTDVYYSGSEAQWDAITGDGKPDKGLVRYNYIPLNTLRYDANGGAGSMEPVTFSGATDFTLPDCGFVPPAGMIFRAWKLDGREYAPGEKCRIDGDAVLVALWERKPFRESTYRADSLANPANSAVAALEACLGGGDTPAWRLLKAGPDAASQVWKYAAGGAEGLTVSVEQKDVYSAVLMELLDAAVSGGELDREAAFAIQSCKTYVSGIADVVNSELGIQLSGAQGDYAAAYRAMTPEAQGRFRETVGKAVGERLRADDPELFDVHVALREIGDGGKLLECAGNLEDYLESYVSCLLLAKECQKYRDFLDAACRLSLTEDNLYLQGALLDCKQAVDGGADSALGQLLSGETAAAGAKAAGYLFRNLFWENAKSGFLAAHPGAALVMAAYAADKAGSAADLANQSATLRATVELEALFFRTYQSLRASYLQNQDAAHARAFVHALEFACRALDQDCVNAANYVDAAARAGKACGESRESIAGAREGYANAYSGAQYGWIDALETDYPGRDLQTAFLAKYRSGVQKTARKEVRAACPVDVYLYDAAGNLAGSVADGVVGGRDENLLLVRRGDEKIVRILSDEAYTVEYRGVGDGTMDLTVTEYGDGEAVTGKAAYYGVPLESGAAYHMDAGSREAALLDQTKNPVPKNVDGLSGGGQRHALSVNCGLAEVDGDRAAEASLYPGERVRVTAAAPEGFSFVRWEADSELVQFDDAAAPTATFTMPEGDAVVSAVLRMDGNLITDMQYLSNGGRPALTVAVHSSRSMRVACAFYSRSGQMLSLELSELKNAGDTEISFPVSAGGALAARFYVLSESGAPLCGSKTLLLPAGA